MPLDFDRPTRVKIIATLGPASEAPEMVGKLVEAGVAVFRINFSHGRLADHQRRLDTIRSVAAGLKRPIAVMGDLCGPKIRVGQTSPEGVWLEPGQDVLLSPTASEKGPSESPRDDLLQLPVTYPSLATEVQPGHRVLIADGTIRMLAVGVRGAQLQCRVRIGGLVTSSKGVNLPDSDISAPAITARDWECVEWAVSNNLDFLALSFVRQAAEVRELRHRLSTMCPVNPDPGETKGAPGAPDPGAMIPVIAKIEKPQALEALDEIIDAADAIMVARGDLGVEMEVAQVPVVQKRILDRCAEWGKPAIVATQMLESMIDSASPTRAEASDVANAVFDGADAVMLSGETAIGLHPALVVETMRRIIAAAEARIAELPYADSAPARLVESHYGTAALAHGAWLIAKDIGARLVVCWSEMGGTARYLSQNNFRVPIIAYSSSARATRRMALLSGVTAIHASPPESGRLEDWTDMVERDLLERGWAHKGEAVVLLAGKPLGKPKATNSIAILHVGDPTGGYRGHAR